MIIQLLGIIPNSRCEVRNLQHNLFCVSWNFPEKQNQYDKELAQVIMEAGKSQDLQGERENRSVRRTNGAVPVSVRRTEDQENRWCSSCLKAGRLETQEELMFWFKCEGRKKVAVPPSGNADEEEEFPLTLFVLFRLSTAWMKSTHMRKGNLLYTVCQFK